MSKWAPLNSIENCGLPPISKAPHAEPGTIVYEAEKHRWYAATDSDGNLFAIKNPCIWETRESNGKIYRTRPKPISIEEALQRTGREQPSRRVERGIVIEMADRVLDQVEEPNF